ncbi:hypothetical protein K456DRAFT_675689 [Colletotrichum gloeosporioides 23]|nr:hypothetical protein K456DRAFT_675689 [Colletotrichum gloeosporioides 23]
MGLLDSSLGALASSPKVQTTLTGYIWSLLMEGLAIPFAQTTRSNPPDMLLPRGRLGTCGCPMTNGFFFHSFFFFFFFFFFFLGSFVLSPRSVIRHPGESELSPLITGGLGCTDGLTGCVRPEALPGLKSSAGELLASCPSQHKRSPSSCISGTRLICARNSSAAGPESRPVSTANCRSHPLPEVQRPAGSSTKSRENLYQNLHRMCGVGMPAVVSPSTHAALGFNDADESRTKKRKPLLAKRRVWVVRSGLDPRVTSQL